MPAVISFNDNFEHNGLRAIKAEFVIYSNIKKVRLLILFIDN